MCESLHWAASNKNWESNGLHRVGQQTSTFGALNHLEVLKKLYVQTTPHVNHITIF